MLYLCHFRMLMNHIQVMLFYHYVNMDQELIQATDESRLWNNSLILFLTHLTSRVKPRKILIRHMKFFSGKELTSIILNEVHMQRKGWEHPIASLVAADWTLPQSLWELEAPWAIKDDRTLADTSEAQMLPSLMQATVFLALRWSH